MPLKGKPGHTPAALEMGENAKFVLAETRVRQNVTALAHAGVAQW